jgi:hypothetical protein
MVRSGEANDTPSAAATSTSTAATSHSSPAAKTGQGDQGQPTTYPPEVTPEFCSEFDCLLNATYHGARAAHYERLHRLLLGLIVISGSGAVAAIALDSSTLVRTAVSLVPVILSAIDLVTSPSVRAQNHAHLKSSYFELLAEIKADPRKKGGSQPALYRLYAKEPPVVFRAVHAMAQNSAIDAMYNEDMAVMKRLYIPWHHRLLASYLTLQWQNYSPKI